MITINDIQFIEVEGEEENDNNRNIGNNEITIPIN